MDNIAYPMFGGGSCKYEADSKQECGDAIPFRGSKRALASVQLVGGFYTPVVFNHGK